MTTAPQTLRAHALGLEARQVLTRELQPATVYVSFPVPVVRDGVLEASFFGAVMVARADGGNEDMQPPTVALTLDWATGRQLALRRLPATSSSTTVAVRPLGFLGQLTPESAQQLDKQRDRLDTLLEAVVARYGASPQRPPMDDGTRYLEQWEDLVPRAARAYYTALNPDFFAWVERGR